MRTIGRDIAVLLGFAVCLGGCFQSAEAPPEPSFYRSLAAHGGELDAAAAQSMISDYRQNNGLSAVELDPVLMSVAQDEARAMAARDKLDHGAGRKVTDRIQAAGYNAKGWVTTYPAGQAVPATSSINFDTTEYAMANNTVVRLGTNGQVCASVGTVNSAPGGSHVILDVTGYVSGLATNQFPMLPAPVRMVDTRTSGGPIPTGASRCFTLVGQGVPATAVGVVLNVTAVVGLQIGLHPQSASPVRPMT